MKNFLLKHWLKFVGIVTGALGGYIYYAKVGCVSGTCPITSDPINSMLYGALMGFLLFGLFQNNPKKKTIEIKMKKKKDYRTNLRNF